MISWVSRKELLMGVVVCFCSLNVLGLRQEDYHYFEVNLDSRVSSGTEWNSVRHCLKRKIIFIS